MTDSVLVHEADGVVVITIDRPAARNAIDHDVSFGVAAAVEELANDPSLRIGVLTGAGGTFSAGMDLKAFLAGEDMLVPGRGLCGICETVAAVEGWALAGRFEIALACDLIIAAEDAHFGIPEVTRGLVAGAGGLLRLPRILPLAIATELALTGDPLPAVDAHRVGLVNSLAPSGGALAAATVLAARIAANGPLVVAATRQILPGAPDWSLAEGFVAQQTIMAPVFGSADAREGAAAFAEKRPPVWLGR